MGEKKLVGIIGPVTKDMIWTEIKFGDIPHKIQNVFQVIETKIPEIRFFLSGPAAKIIESAERAFPILDLGTESDPNPYFKPITYLNTPWKKSK